MPAPISHSHSLEQSKPEEVVIDLGPDVDADDPYMEADDAEALSLGEDVDVHVLEISSTYEEPRHLGEPMDADALGESLSQNQGVRHIGEDMDIETAHFEDTNGHTAPIDLGPDIDVPVAY